MTPSRLIALLCVTLVLVIQVGVPVATLASPRPARFGWHMYSAVRGLPEVAVRMRTGDVEPVDVAALLARPRGEIHYADAITRHLCAGRADVASVIVTEGGFTGEQPCD